MPVFAAGNERGPGQYQPPSQPIWHWDYWTIGGVLYIYYNNYFRPLNDAQGGFNNLASYAMSKNALIVGADSGNTNGYTGPSSVGMSTFSSWGPTADGRIKPDITAAGVNILSSVAEATNAYSPDSGTSMAAPAVTGTIGLLVGLYKQLYGTNYPPMLSSTLAGIVVHTADQAGTNTGPNYMFGWGQLNALSAANLISNNFASGSLAFIEEPRLVSGDYIQFPVKLTNGVPFRVTLRWTDPPGTPVAPALNPTNHMLVNDLDLRVISPAGVTNYPYRLNPASPASPATTGDNTVDNVEQVYLSNPATGTYLVQVTHKGTLVNDKGQTSYQNASLILSGNIVQPPILPNITSFAAQTVSNTVSLKWSSEVGRVYRVQSKTNITSGTWQYGTGELSATKTNAAALLPAPAGASSQFYRVVQVR